MLKFGPVLRDAWRLFLPYFRSEERWSARGLLGVVIALNLLSVAADYAYNQWNGAFFNALQGRDEGAFWKLFGLSWTGPDGSFVLGFTVIAAVIIGLNLASSYLQQVLEIRWRRWLTGRFRDEWLSERAYYRISLAGETGDPGTDNPDQRISDDVRDYVRSTLSLSLGLLTRIVSFITFVGLLWALSGPVTLGGVTIPGYMVWVVVAYAVVGTALTQLVGRPLIGLNFAQQRREADFRFALVRLRENAEGVALYGGEADERANLQNRFGGVVSNFYAIIWRTLRLNALQYGYQQVAIVFPFLVQAPRYFSGAIPLGTLTRTANAFGEVQRALSYFVNVYESFANWSAMVSRLASFDRALAAARSAAAQGPALSAGGDALRLSDVSLALPDGTPLVQHLSLDLPPGASTVISGRSGSGKSTLFRALAGIWPFGSGRIERPAGGTLFLPQRPYFPLGTLRHAVSYPAAAGGFDDGRIAAALRDAGLGHLAGELDAEAPWGQRLSGGEQQRLAVARALLLRPAWLFMDEATANLDPESERELLARLRERLPGTTIVSIAHRPEVAAAHDRRLVLRREPGRAGTLAAAE